MDLNQLGTYLQSEVSIRAQENRLNKDPNTSSIYMVEKIPNY